MVSLDFLLGVAAGLGLSGVTFLVIRWYQRRQLRQLQSAPSLAPAVWPASAPPNVAPASPASSDAPPPVSAAPEDGWTVNDLAAATPHRTEPRSERAVPDGAVQLSHRVVIHLYRQGRFRPDEVPTRSISQSGMIEALQVRQGALAGVLLRLEAAGIVSSETSHIRGGSRRVKVYRLTERGTELAKGLRSDPTMRRTDPGGHDSSR